MGDLFQDEKNTALGIIQDALNGKKTSSVALLLSFFSLRKKAQRHIGKPRLFVSFSGGKTSAWMTKWIIENLSSTHDIIVGFANTGEENEATLRFVHMCDSTWGFNTVWLESMPIKSMTELSIH